MQHAWKHVERPGGSHTALDGKKGKSMMPPNFWRRRARSSKAYKTSHPKGSLTLKQPYASFARLAVYWIVVQYLPVTKYPKRKKPYCFLIIQPKEPVRHRKNSMHRFHHALMTSTISHTTKTCEKSSYV